jgi:hypothetical protein
MKVASLLTLSTTDIQMGAGRSAVTHSRGGRASSVCGGKKEDACGARHFRMLFGLGCGRRGETHRKKSHRLVDFGLPRST